MTTQSDEKLLEHMVSEFTKCCTNQQRCDTLRENIMANNDEELRWTMLNAYLLVMVDKRQK